MAIIFSKFGKEEIQKSSLRPLAQAKLFIGDGDELTGHGYQAKQIDLERWDLSTGEYPTLEWEFTADVPVEVKGYFITDAMGNIVMYENFQEPQTIQHTGDKIMVTIKLSPVVNNRVASR